MTARPATSHSRAGVRAERCFAVARSTTFSGEREAAISRGAAIVEAAGLSLDDFDVPGRRRAAARGPQVFTSEVHSFAETARAREWFWRREEEVARAAEAARIAQEAAITAALQTLHRMADAAAVALRREDFTVHEAPVGLDGGRRWFVLTPRGEDFGEVDDDRLSRIAVTRPATRADVERELAHDLEAGSLAAALWAEWCGR